MLDGRPFNPFSQAFRDDLTRLRRDMDGVVEALARIQQVVPVNNYGRTPFVLTGHGSTSSSYPIWTYSGTEKKPASATGTDADWATLTGAESSTNTLVNDLEAGNTSTSAYGYPVAYSGGIWSFSTAPFTSCQFLPVPTGIIVWALPVIRPDGTLRWHFSAPNLITPACEA